MKAEKGRVDKTKVARSAEANEEERLAAPQKTGVLPIKSAHFKLAARSHDDNIIAKPGCKFDHSRGDAYRGPVSRVAATAGSASMPRGPSLPWAWPLGIEKFSTPSAAATAAP
jgi:hypothetical protein